MHLFDVQDDWSFVCCVVFYHFAGEKCVFAHYIKSLGESLGADNLFSTDIMRTSRQDSHGVNAPQALGSRCIHCRGEFGSRVAMACHRRHPASIGTPGEDPKSAKPISNTGRANVSSSSVREHATLGTLILFQYIELCSLSIFVSCLICIITIIDIIQT